MVFLYFAVVFVFAELFVGFNYMIYFFVLNDIAGVYFPFWNFNIFVEGCFITFPIVIFVSILAVFFCLLKNGLRLASFCCSCAIICACAFFLLPAFFNVVIELHDANYRAISEFECGAVERPHKYLSAGYFRNTLTGTYFFTKADDEKGIDGVFYPNENSALPSDIPVVFEGATYPLASARLLRDPLMARNLKPSRLFLTISQNYLRWFESCARSATKSKHFALQFALMAAPICAIGLLVSISSWKMINFLVVCLAPLLVVLLNWFTVFSADFDAQKIFLANALFKQENLEIIASFFVNGILTAIFLFAKFVNVVFVKKTFRGKKWKNFE